uniref:non-specific serine/threonine protein kinase n=1 Tax=Nicotiana sylvestris TaxID=4096 RepID=A0A1U7WRF3_NICSY
GKRVSLLRESLPNFYKESLVTDDINQAKFEELLVYNFDILASATDNFHLSSKLGQGGFGPVYKGKLPEGKEIAVKRLSQSSGQGLEEFMNEVVVISKLQHRNLVKLLGCCTERGEKMLVYEYMPKRSLDAYLFGSNPEEKEFLDWSKRVIIIEGIGRGLLYLHRDSRLKIIHRDLKASNILLDEQLNPKISDFGMARIFPGNQDQANTERVVGTYGYMAPEYAMEGRFSEKSDVYSFGVLLLEIISGRRNTSFHQDDCALSLLACAWKCWNENNIVELVDPKIIDMQFEREILRCAHVGLLCVQEYAEDRPNVSVVLSMLTSEISDLPSPKQPAFTTRPSCSKKESSKTQGSVNTVSITIMEGRSNALSDTISINQSLSGSETLVSKNNIFILGFFSPENSTNRYVGIMFNTQSQSVVWVANRDSPLQDSSGRITISEGGNLVILNAQKKSIWSSNISTAVRNTTAQLSDTGNLVLKDSSSGRTLWESFSDLSDSFLQYMKLGSDKSTNTTNLLKSWRSPLDPSDGSFSAGIQPETIPQIFIWKNGLPHWRSGPWNKQIFIGVPEMTSFYFSGFELVNDNMGTAYFSYTYSDQDDGMLYLVLNSTGFLQQKELYDRKNDWTVTWATPANECDFYGKCGPYGSCDPNSSPICTCLQGFKPKSQEEWGKGNWTNGCIRKTALENERNNSNIEQGKQDWFLRLQSMKVPDSAIWDACIGKESYLMFRNSPRAGQIYSFVFRTLSLIKRKILKSHWDRSTSRLNSSCHFWIFSCKYLAKHRGRKRVSLLRESLPNFYKESMVTDDINQAKFEELPLYNFDMLANATDNFHLSSKLGHGGFGTVYKGQLPEGQEIAVKRLSQSSGQGLEEFMNEVVVISKLQHRNLVRLLGCCIERGEKMLVYEFMPKRSLDAYIFGSHLEAEDFLDWSKRAIIIEGIGRGLLYLHRDSRLRIIHRDLKASNILLDEYLNPKISDFGMARIFSGNQDQANTSRVVGTYGYMAPEYAMEGRFSEKSDVYSFGVLLLEIISGRRNTSFHQDDCAISLLAYAWKRWNENKIVELVDPKIIDLQLEKEILRCVHVGLLCVQEYAEDRPNVSTVLSMLTREIADLPSPKQPAFTTGPSCSNKDSCRTQGSVNTVSITTMEGR